MIFTQTALKGAWIIDIEKHEDERGFFARSWCINEMAERDIHMNILQANVSLNKKKGTLRGMHYQLAPHQEAKLVRCSKGRIFDVIIDLRKKSPTYKQWTGVELTSDNYKMLYIPEDFAHGFITLDDNSEISYFMSQIYVPASAATIRWNDPQFGINWPINPLIISEKDKNQADFRY